MDRALHSEINQNIIALLKESTAPLTVVEIAGKLGCKVPSVRHRLKTLQKKNEIRRICTISDMRVFRYTMVKT